jgi:hypothetical protein
MSERDFRPRLQAFINAVDSATSKQQFNGYLTQSTFSDTTLTAPRWIQLGKAVITQLYNEILGRESKWDEKEDKGIVKNRAILEGLATNNPHAFNILTELGNDALMLKGVRPAGAAGAGAAPSAPAAPVTAVVDALFVVLQKCIDALEDRDSKTMFQQSLELKKTDRFDPRYSDDFNYHFAVLGQGILQRLYAQIIATVRSSTDPRDAQTANARLAAVNTVKLRDSEAFQRLLFLGREALAYVPPVTGGYRMSGGSCYRRY